MLRENDWMVRPYVQGHAERVCVWVFCNLSVFWQNVLVKFPDLMLSVNLEYFIIKDEMQNSINIQSRRNQTFTGDGGF